MSEGSISSVERTVQRKNQNRIRGVAKSLVYVVADFLKRHGYAKSYETFSVEAKLSQEEQICDNIDLETVMEGYLNYYHMQFNKYPDVLKRSGCMQNTVEATKTKKPATKPKCTDAPSEATEQKDDFVLVTKPIFPEKPEAVYEKAAETVSEGVTNGLPKPLHSLYPSGSEWMTIAELISKEIVQRDLNVQWDKIVGLAEEKQRLKASILYPLKHPLLFDEMYPPWKSVLLYGPPGTGKTMLAKAVATECNCTFFNITSSSIVSKWRGDSEKYVRVLFDLANFYAPSVIFIDEIDWIGSATRDGSAEPARRFRAEFLIRFDGLLTAEKSGVVLLAATNLPWDIDTALLRRLEKRIYVGLPNEETRIEILRPYLLPDEKTLYGDLVEFTDGYSCADLKLLLKEAWTARILRNGVPSSKSKLKQQNKYLTVADVKGALKHVRRTVLDNRRYESWTDGIEKR